MKGPPPPNLYTIENIHYTISRQNNTRTQQKQWKQLTLTREHTHTSILSPFFPVRVRLRLSRPLEMIWLRVICVRPSNLQGKKVFLMSAHKATCLMSSSLSITSFKNALDTCHKDMKTDQCVDTVWTPFCASKHIRFLGCTSKDHAKRVLKTTNTATISHRFLPTVSWSNTSTWTCSEGDGAAGNDHSNVCREERSSVRHGTVRAMGATIVLSWRQPRRKMYIRGGNERSPHILASYIYIPRSILGSNYCRWLSSSSLFL